MIIQNSEKPSLQELAHFGVKGMKWGQHKKSTSSSPLNVSGGKTNRRPTRDEILSARNTQKELQAHIKSLDKKHGKEGKYYKLTQEHLDAYDKLLEGDARVVSKYKTRGEQTAATLLLGPIGLVLARNTKGRVRSRLANQRA